MKKWMCVAMLAVFAVAAASAASAQESVRWPKFWERKKAVEEMALTPEQVSALAAIDVKYAQSAIELQAKAKVAQLKFDYLIKKGDGDEKALSDLIAQIADARREQTALALQRMVEVRKLLNPEQWEKVSRMIARRRGERDGKGPRGKGMGMRGGDESGYGPSGPGRGPAACPMMGAGAPAAPAVPAEGAPPAEK